MISRIVFVRGRGAGTAVHTGRDGQRPDEPGPWSPKPFRHVVQGRPARQDDV